MSKPILTQFPLCLFLVCIRMRLQFWYSSLNVGKKMACSCVILYLLLKVLLHYSIWDKMGLENNWEKFNCFPCLSNLLPDMIYFVRRDRKSSSSASFERKSSHAPSYTSDTLFMLKDTPATKSPGL